MLNIWSSFFCCLQQAPNHALVQSFLTRVTLGLAGMATVFAFDKPNFSWMDLISCCWWTFTQTESLSSKNYLKWSWIICVSWHCHCHCHVILQIYHHLILTWTPTYIQYSRFQKGVWQNPMFHSSSAIGISGLEPLPIVNFEEFHSSWPALKIDSDMPYRVGAALKGYCCFFKVGWIQGTGESFSVHSVGKLSSLVVC